MTLKIFLLLSLNTWALFCVDYVSSRFKKVQSTGTGCGGSNPFIMSRNFEGEDESSTTNSACSQLLVYDTKEFPIVIPTAPVVDEVTPTGPPPYNKCSGDYKGAFTLISSKYYYLGTALKTYDNAVSFCQTYGASLAVGHTSDDFNAIKTIKSLEFNIWVGLKAYGTFSTCYDAGCDGILKWIDNTTFAYDTSFMADPVKVNTNKRCVELNQETSMRMLGSNCGQSQKFICQCVE